uniref:Uncharacterized protein n=1 Tax=Setaria viridis TaxID=4556 RepID=A0A4U6U7N6_SETVI|nr:hypothetical protein SEVIR_6G252600v2 [Setaria viridis]
MAAPNRVDQPPASPTAGQDPGVAPDQAGQDPGVAPDQDPTQLLSKLFAGTTLGMPTDAPNHIRLQPPAAAAPAGASVSPTAGPDPGATSSYGDDLTRVLTSAVLAKQPLATPAAPLKNIFAGQPPPAAGTPAFPMAGRDTEVPSYRIRIRPNNINEFLEKLVGEATTPVTPPVATPSSRATKQAGGGSPERAAARRRFSVPTDYLRAGQESRERRRRRKMVRRNVRRIFSTHKDRANDRVLSAMMARQATLEPVAPPAAGDGSGAAASKDDAAAPSSEDPELEEMLMELSFKD